MAHSGFSAILRGIKEQDHIFGIRLHTPATLFDEDNDDYDSSSYASSSNSHTESNDKPNSSKYISTVIIFLLLLLCIYRF